MKLTFHTIISNNTIVLLGCFCFLLINTITAQTDTENWVRTKTYKAPTTTSQPHTSADVTTNVTYLDGLGRPLQQVAYRQGGNGGDLITPIDYDALGRQQKEYLPYVRNSASLNMDSGALNSVGTFYNTQAFQNTTNPYSENEFENSPLNRILKIAAPGNDWAMESGHEVKFNYLTNNTNEVYFFKVSTTGTLPQLQLQVNVHYPANQLYTTITYDENNTSKSVKGSIVEYKDKLGRIVLKRHFNTESGRATEINPAKPLDTYYVYDDFGNLAIVLPPEVSKKIVVGSSLVATHQEMIDGLGYQYSYDHRNRLIRKKLPGKGIEFISYDPLDRPISVGPVLSPFGDGALGSIRTKYDIFGRVAYTMWVQGWLGESTRVAAENNPGTNYAESRITNSSPSSVNGVAFSYTNNVSPTSGYHILTINYYDDYNWQGAPAAIPSTVCNGLSNVYYNNTTKPKGLPTGSWVRILTDEQTSDAKIMHTLYDKKSRPIRVRTDYTNAGYTQVDTQYNFIGNPLVTITKHKKETNNTEQIVKETFTYDEQERLEYQAHKVNNLPEELLAKNEYNPLGQLITKKTGGTDLTGGTYFQKVDYKYNIRGWLTDINDVNNLQANPVDLFAFKINYNDYINQDINGQVIKLYNGNIAETTWRTSSDNIARKYGYSYDYINRLLDAWYQRPATSTPLPQSFDEHLTYDDNGNINTLQRNGLQELTYPIPIDELAYRYRNNTNQLKKVLDSQNNEEGFNGTENENPDGDNTTDYYYDSFGNLIIDENKNITQITYNHLNLPSQVTFGTMGSIAYIYSADGVKLTKTVTKAGQAMNTHYRDGFQYIEDDLDFFPHAEGTVEVTQNPNLVNDSYNYIFHYLDHLGNIRIRYAKDTSDDTVKILEEKHYYPFGLQHKGYNQQRSGFRSKALNNTIVLTPIDPFVGSTYTYGFGGKEYQDELDLNMYDFGARNYMPDLGRWSNVDPFSENYFDNSPYNYVANNPIFYIDPDGMQIKDPDKVAEKYKGHLETTNKNIRSLVNSGNLNEDIGNKLTSFNNSELKKIKQLEKSDQVYTFSSNNSSNEGEALYDSSSEEVLINVDKNNLGVIGHELNHAYQFEKGEISFLSDNSGYGSLYDVGDETSSYNVERGITSGLAPFKSWENKDVLNFGKTKMTPPAYQTLPTISIKLRSKQGKDLRKKTIEAGNNGTPVKEVYIGWQKDYAKGAKQKK